MERLDAFMARANVAYYATHDPFADFTTAPEISQVFGEILGLWAAVVWQALGAPDPVLLVEAGPGRGTFMQDALRAIGRAAPAFRAALRLHLIETSPRLREVQAKVLPEATWHDGLATLPEAPLILLANEFLDALPIRQFVRVGDAWAERFVEEGRFVEGPVLAAPPVLMPPASLSLVSWPGLTPPPTSLAGALEEDVGGGANPGHDTGGNDTESHDTRVNPEGRVVIEVNECARDCVGAIARHVATHSGAALFLDYGPSESAFGDSLQALHGGRPTDPLGPPGSADLTAHVDFAALADVARATGAAVHGPLPQGVFLTRLGLFQRTGALARGQPATRAAALMDAANRLAEPDRMGRLFKALAVVTPVAPTPPGFE